MQINNTQQNLQIWKGFAVTPWNTRICRENSLPLSNYTIHLLNCSIHLFLRFSNWLRVQWLTVNLSLGLRMKLPSTVCAHEILLNGTNHQFNWVSNRNLSHYVCRNETMQGNLIHWKTVWTICGAHCVDFGVGSSVRAKKRKKLINCCLLSHSPLKSEQLDQISEQILQEQLWNLERFSRVLTFFYPVRLIINCTQPSAFWVKSLKWCREYSTPAGSENRRYQ